MRLSLGVSLSGLCQMHFFRDHLNPAEKRSIEDWFGTHENNLKPSTREKASYIWVADWKSEIFEVFCLIS